MVGFKSPTILLARVLFRKHVTYAISAPNTEEATCEKMLG
jgi:hypothetical protein